MYYVKKMTKRDGKEGSWLSPNEQNINSWLNCWRVWEKIEVVGDQLQFVKLTFMLTGEQMLDG